MGLDLIELVIAVEERFGITLSDGEISNAETPGQLIDLANDKVEKAGSGECLTSRAFYSVRRAFMKELQWHRSEVVPSARLEGFSPEKKAAGDLAAVVRRFAGKPMAIFEASGLAGLEHFPVRFHQW